MISFDKQKPTYQQRIDALRQTKLEHTELKLKQRGYFDIDDHGSIPWPEPIPFKAKPNHESGGCYGTKCIGENFRAWLEAHPVYIHPMSALAGAWVSSPTGVGGWKPEDRPTHLYPLHKKYNIIYTGIGAMNHLGPDMKIGLDLGWGGILAKIRRYRELNQPENTDFYDGEEAFVLGMQAWIKKHVIKARDMATAPPLYPPRIRGGKRGGQGQLAGNCRYERVAGGRRAADVAGSMSISRLVPIR